MTIKVGDSLPSATFVVMTPDGPGPVSTEDFFKGKKVALFGVPGAFTPTCSVQHLPSFADNVEALKAKGVDEIVCVAVNDIFVLAAWSKAEDVEGSVTMLSDGSGDFTKAAGLEFDLSGKGLGVRMQRFSAVIDDGVVKALNIEEPGAYEVSSGEKLLEQL